MKTIGIILFILVLTVCAQEKPGAPVGSSVSFVEQHQSLAPVAGRGVALRDFNGDGKLDAFVVVEKTAESQGLRVYFGDGHGNFSDSGQALPYTSPFTHRPAVADVDGDGDLDVVVGGTLWINDGKGFFSQRDILVDGSKLELTAVALADVDGDGRPDLVGVELWKTIRIFLNESSGHFRDGGQRCGLGANAGSAMIAGLALADMDGNGSVDVVSTGWRNNPTDACPNRIWLNDGKGDFHDSGRVLDEGKRHVHGIAIGDLDGDGLPDIALALTQRAQACKVYLNAGHGEFRDSGQKLGEAWAHAVLLGDFNKDGALDVFLVCGDPKKGTPNQVLLNDGKGGFADSGLRLGNAFSWDGAVGDFDGDGYADVFVVNLRQLDDAKMSPSFGGAQPEVWINTTPRR